ANGSRQSGENRAPRDRSALVAEDSTRQQLLGPASDRAQALEFQLHVHRIVLLALAVADVVAAEQAQRVAAALVLEAGEGLDGGLVAQRVVPAPDHPPARPYRHQPGAVQLLQAAAAVAVGQVGDAA